MQSRPIQRRQIEGWGFSLILHRILLSAIIPAFRYLPTPIHPEPFRWDVTFAESPQQTTLVEPDSDVSFTKEFLRTSEVEVPSSVSLPTDVPRPPEQTKRDSFDVAEESSNTRPMLATPPPTLIAQPQPEGSPEMPSTKETTPVTQETLSCEQPKTNMAATPVRNEPSARPMAPIEQESPS